MSAAETVLHGGPAALLAAAGADALRAAGAYSLLETTASQGWHLARRARARARPPRSAHGRLARPQPARACRGRSAATRTTPRRSSASPGPRCAHVFARAARRGAARDPPLAPDGADRGGRVRRAAVGRARRGAAARGRDRAARSSTSRSTRSSSASPARRRSSRASDRTRCSPRTSGSGSRCACGATRFPIVDGGTAILAHRFSRHFAHPTQQPYRPFFHVARTGRDPELLAEAERAAAGTRAGIESYRAGAPCIRSCRSATGTRASRRSAGSARSSSRAPRTRPPSGSSASSRCTASARRSSSRAAARAARRGSASSSARRTFRYACGDELVRSRPGTSCGPAAFCASAFASSASATVPVSST